MYELITNITRFLSKYFKIYISTLLLLYMLQLIIITTVKNLSMMVVIVHQQSNTLLDVNHNRSNMNKSM